MTVFIAAPGTETLPVRMFLYIQDNIDPLVTSVSACVIADHRARADRARPRLRARPAAGRKERGDGRMSDYDVAVVGGGLVGVAIAWGLAREGCRVVVLDEGDIAQCAPRAATSRWSGCRARASAWRAYAGWTMRSSDAWAGFAQTAEGGDRSRCLLPAARRLPSRAVGDGAGGARQHAEAPAQPAGHRRLQDRDPGPRRRSRRCCRTSGPRWSAAAIARSTATSIRCACSAPCTPRSTRAASTYLPSHRGRDHRAGAAASSG